MAFPLEPSRLIAHIRGWHLTLENGDYALSIIGPVNHLATHLGRLLPPITFPVARHVNKLTLAPPVKISARKRTTRRHSYTKIHDLALAVQRDQPLVSSPITPDPPKDHAADTDLILVDSHNSDRKSGANIHRQRRMSSFFLQLPSSDSDDSSETDRDSGASVGNKELHRINEEASPGSNAVHVNIDEQEHRGQHEQDYADVLTIDSDFGVPIDASGKVVSKTKRPNSFATNSPALRMVSRVSSDRADFDASTATGTNDSDLDDDDFEFDDILDGTFFNDGEDASSFDSAFTDIEGRSHGSSSLPLNSYSVGALLGSFSMNDDLTDARKPKGRKRADSLSQSYRGWVDSSRKGSAPTPALSFSASSMLKTSKSLGNMRRPALLFDKIQLPTRIDTDPSQSAPKPSQLSEMIASKSKSNNVNPLHYFSFVKANDANSGSATKISVFCPPLALPLLVGLEVDSTISIADLIGYILLSLWQTPGQQHLVLDPLMLDLNRWRLELVDEDGENYGSFGVLDRTRALKLYNCPSDVALCSVTSESEVALNNSKSPLPAEFKNSLARFTRRRKGRDSIGSAGAIADKIQLKILTHGSTLKVDFSMFEASPEHTVAQVLANFCAANRLVPQDYSLRQVVPKFSKDSKTVPISHVSRSLEDTDQVQDLSTLTLDLVPHHQLIKNVETPVTGPGTAITPSNMTLLINHLTPEQQRKDVAASSTPMASGGASRRRHQSKLEELQSNVLTNQYLHDVILGRTSQLPANLNSIYFKWRVFRRKPTILNKIEKFFIIDGDYIHITPSDDVVLKQAPFEFSDTGEAPSFNRLRSSTDLLNPGATTSANSYTNTGTSAAASHTHHYLSQYNYNKHYKELMMKTSSFHITQIVKMKLYKDTKHAKYFKIVISKQVVAPDASGFTPPTKDAAIKKYVLEAESVADREAILKRLAWVSQVYSNSNVGDEA